jgi:hypothetical protein
MATNYKLLMDGLNLGKGVDHVKNNRERMQFIYANELA